MPATVDIFRPSLLAEPKPRWKYFSASAAIQLAVLLLLLWIPLLLPQRLISAVRYSVIPLLESKPVTPWKPQPPPQFKVRPVPAQQNVEVRVLQPIVLPKPRPELRSVPPKPELPSITPNFDVAKLLPSPEPSRPKPEIKTGVLSNGSSAPASVNLPLHKVQTGGFGDPNGMPATGDGKRAATIARVGSFDLPPGPGYGNGTGGASGIRGAVQSAGFGNGIAVQSGNGGGGNGTRAGTVQQGVFNDATQPVQATKKAAASETPSVQPLEILAKPNPVYTAEARHLKIEGEVLLQVVFTATGAVQVLKVVRGLGHGLDETAIAAAEHIRFKPERINGKPVDSTATVHIVFQLAY